MQQWRVMKQWVACGLCGVLGAGVQAAAPVLVYPDELLPPRMVLCQRELGPAAQNRQRQLRTCLARRLEGERVIERQCRRQAAGVSGGVGARSQAQRACERQALAVPSSELPRRPPPPPRPAAAPEPAPVATQAPVPQPAAGEN